MSPPVLIAHKVIAYHARRGQPKAGTDWRDLAMLLLTFPELKKEKGAVSEALKLLGAKEDVMETWRGLAIQELIESDEEGEFEFNGLGPELVEISVRIPGYKFSKKNPNRASNRSLRSEAPPR